MAIQTTTYSVATTKLGGFYLRSPLLKTFLVENSRDTKIIGAFETRNLRYAEMHLALAKTVNPVCFRVGYLGYIFE